MRKSIASVILAAFLANICVPPSYAQAVLDLPVPGTAVNLSQAFSPVMIRGINVHPDNAMMFDFIVDPGESGLDKDTVGAEATKMIKYFMAALAVPEDDLWVNLSPYENDRIIPEALGQTEMGRDMLAQDYLLKQVTASLIDPQDELGREFWDRVYKEAYEKYGTADVPVDTFNKVWIMPAKAVVYENKGKAVVVESSLKVMLEADYLAMSNNALPMPSTADAELTKNILREIVIPVLEKEVNTGKNFTQLRQLYNSLILAHWFRNNLKESVLNRVYTDRSRVRGVDVEDKEIARKIYARYVESFKKGVYNYVKEEYDPFTQEMIPRKYFSGGETFNSAALDAAMTRSTDASDGQRFSREIDSRALVVTASFKDVPGQDAITAREYRPKGNRPVVTHIPAEEWRRFGDGEESFQVVDGRLFYAYPWVITETSYRKVNLDFEITSRIIDLYEQGKGRSRNDPIVVLDWGCAEGVAITGLLNIVKILKKKYPDLNVRVIGYSRDFYPSWSEVPLEADMIVDEAKDLKKGLEYLGVKQLDLVFSRLGFTHFLHAEKNLALKHLQQLGTLLSPVGEMRMDIPGDITDLEYAQIGLASAGLVRSGSTYGLRVDRIVPLSSVPERGRNRAVLALTQDKAEAVVADPKDVIADLKNKTLLVGVDRREAVLLGESMNLIFRDGNIVYRVMKRLPREDEEYRFEIAEEIERGMRLAADKGYGPKVLGTGYTGNDKENGRFYIAVEFLPGKDLREDPSFPRDRFKEFIADMINDGIFIYDFTPEQFIYDEGTGEFKLADSEKTRPVITHYGFVDSVYKSMFDYLKPQRKWDAIGGLPGLCDAVLAQMDELLRKTRESGGMSLDHAQADPRLALSVGSESQAWLKARIEEMFAQAGYAGPEDMVRRTLSANNILGTSSQTVLIIPGIRDLCLKIDMQGGRGHFLSDGKGLEMVKNIMPGDNVGQPLAHVGNAMILLMQHGKPAGISMAVEFDQRHDIDGIRKYYLNYLRDIANFPQASYDRFAALYEKIKERGLMVDMGTSQNLMVDLKKQDINFIDIGNDLVPGKLQGEFAGLLLMLLDVNGLAGIYDLEDLAGSGKNAREEGDREGHEENDESVQGDGG